MPTLLTRTQVTPLLLIVLITGAGSCRENRPQILATSPNATSTDSDPRNAPANDRPQEPAKDRPQNRDPDTADDTLLRAMHKNLAAAFEGDLVNILPSPILITSVYDLPTSTPQEMAILNSVPEKSDYQYKPSETGLLERMKQILPDVKLGEVQITAEDAAKLKKATEVLYSDQGLTQPTPSYRKYLDIKAKLKKIDDRLKDKTNPPTEAERNVLQFDRSELMLELRKAWASIIEDALDTYKRLSTSGDVGVQYKGWQALLSKEDSAGTYDSVWTALSSQDGWVAITNPVKLNKGLSITAVPLPNREAVKRAPKNVADNKVLSLSMRIARAPIQRPALDHPFLQSRNWTTKGKLISSGKPDETLPNELVPWYVAQLIIAKEIELDFPDVASWKGAAEALQNATGPMLIGGVSLTKENLFFSPKHIVYTKPLIVGVIVRRMHRAPDPDPRLK